MKNFLAKIFHYEHVYISRIKQLKYLTRYSYSYEIYIFIVANKVVTDENMLQH